METSQDTLVKGREGYRIIANRGAICFNTAQYMREINPLYQMSMKQFLEIYDTAIAHSDRLEPLLSFIWIFKVDRYLGSVYPYPPNRVDTDTLT